MKYKSISIVAHIKLMTLLNDATLSRVLQKCDRIRSHAVFFFIPCTVRQTCKRICAGYDLSYG